MKYTQNLNMKIPEGWDPIDIADITGNFETLDIEINKKANTSGGDISDTTIKTVDAIATEFSIPSAGESSKTFLGKIRKFIQNFIAIKDTLLTLSKLVNNGQTTASGFALDARYGKTLYDLYAQLNTNLGGSTLQKNTFLASANDGCGYMFSEIGNDTGIGSDGDGILYFMSNSNKHFLKDMALTYFYNAGATVNLNDAKQTGFHRFEGAVPILNDPSGVNNLGDCTMLVSGATHGFQVIFVSNNIYYRNLAWDGDPSQWRRIAMVSN